jgi:hypothetical protein
MKRNGGLFMCLVGGLFGVLCCALKKMPEGELVSVEYTRSGTMAGYVYEGHVERDSTGGFMLRAMKENYGPLFEKELDAEAVNMFRQIIQEEKMYKYKEVYRPMLEVLDGWGWSFRATFSDGSVISSHGSNASPSGDGLDRIRDYMAELIQDAVKICPEE